MGRLTAAQMSQLETERPAFGQKFGLTVPTDSVHSTFDSRLFHDTANFGDDRLVRVLKAGRRRHKVFNPHPNDTDTEPESVVWRFQASNEDSFWHDGAGRAFRPGSSTYQARPTEAEVYHDVYLYLPGTGWSWIDELSFRGRIIELQYVTTARPVGVPLPLSVVVTVEQVGAWEILRRVWTPDDGEVTDVSGTTYGDLLI